MGHLFPDALALTVPDGERNDPPHLQKYFGGDFHLRGAPEFVPGIARKEDLRGLDNPIRLRRGEYFLAHPCPGGRARPEVAGCREALFNYRRLTPR